MSVSGFLELVAALLRAEVRFVLIGVEGVNHYARAAGTVFTTHDRDLFLPPDAANEQRALQATATSLHCRPCHRSNTLPIHSEPVSAGAEAGDPGVDQSARRNAVEAAVEDAARRAGSHDRPA